MFDWATQPFYTLVVTFLFGPYFVNGFMADPAPVVGLSCMANLLPFALLAARRLKERYPEVTVVLGGVGAKAVERKILERFDWIDVVAHGEGERSIVPLLQALQNLLE